MKLNIFLKGNKAKKNDNNNNTNASVLNNSTDNIDATDINSQEFADNRIDGCFGIKKEELSAEILKDIES